MIRASLTLLEGRHRAAGELADQALAIGRRGGHTAAEFFDLVFRSHLAQLTGADLGDIETAVRRFAADGPFLARTWHATVLAAMSRPDEAAAVWAGVVPHLAELPRHTPEWIVAMVSHAELCVMLGQPDPAPAVYADLLPFADRYAIAGAHTPSRGPVAWYLGRLAMLMNDRAAAAAHFQRALELSIAMAAPAFEAQARIELARLLSADGTRDAGRQAGAQIGAAVAIADRLELPGLAAAAVAVKPAGQGPLSRRENDVAGLIAEGMSNRQIARRLSLSERTVEAHMRSIFAKLGFDSRARVASWYVINRTD